MSTTGTGRLADLGVALDGRGLNERGQMTVELAAMLPVMVVVALLVVNLARFAEACATFDRVAPDAVVGHGVSPSGEQSIASARREVRQAIEDALASESCEVVVDATGAGDGGPTRGLAFPVSPLLTTYRCELRYHPWPGSVAIAGVGYALPVALTHERSITVDRFRPGVVI